MQGFEASDNLDEYVPDLLLLDVCLPFLIRTNLLEDIAIISILHYQATFKQQLINKIYIVIVYLPQTAAWVINESLLVSNDTVVVYAC